MQQSSTSLTAAADTATEKREQKASCCSSRYDPLNPCEENDERRVRGSNKDKPRSVLPPSDGCEMIHYPGAHECFSKTFFRPASRE